MTAPVVRTERHAPSPDPADLTRLRDEIRALVQLIPAALVPGAGRSTAPHDSLSDEEATEAGFDNLPL